MPITDEARTVGERVGEEVERVGLQRLRAGVLARRHLDHEHRGVDSDDRDQPAAVVVGHAVEGNGMVVAVVGAHALRHRAESAPDQGYKVTERLTFFA